MNRVFEVPADLLPEFSEMIAENELANELIGRNENDDVLIEVHYRANQKGEILELVDWLEENVSLNDELSSELNED